MISIVLDTSFMHKVGEIKAIAKKDEQVKLKTFKRLRPLAVCFYNKTTHLNGRDINTVYI